MGLAHLGHHEPILLLNDDTVCEPAFLANLHAAAIKHGEGIYQPLILLDDGSGRIDNTGHRLTLDGFNCARFRGTLAQNLPTSAPEEVGAFSGAAVLLTPTVLAETGGFDPDFEAFGEDVDLSLRARRLGFRIRFVPEARVRHALGASYGRGGAWKSYRVERNRVRAAIRSLPLPALAAMPAITGLRLGLMGSAALMGRGLGTTAGPTGAAAALLGGLAGWLSLGDALKKRQHDRPTWRADDREIWSHLLRHHVLPADLFSMPLETA
jgi:N-acetylglucosaminyl-diphospho-decaprenol L-rhamnosyltransferase